ncbi:hypothetical protein GCM10028778_11710 [Barrientosiimonas marina]|uniref:Transglycosylase SLT domain-containing protein n=1 Tax=Lentibacillus kimchii TaxID=1542911 RepID=A0ABW2V100_9BACI
MATGGKPLGEMTVGMSLDGTNFSKTLKGIQKQIKTSQSAMKANISVLTSAGDQYGALEAKVNGLNDTMSANRQNIDQLRSKYDEMANTYGENSEQAQKYAKQLNDAIRKQSSYQKQLDNTKTKMSDLSRGTEDYKERIKQSTRKINAQVKAHESQGDVYQANASKLKGLKESHELQEQVVENEKDKLEELKQTYGENSSEVREQETALEEARSQYTQLGSSIESIQDQYGNLNEKMAGTADKLNKVGDNIQNTSGKVKSFGSKWTKASAAGVGAIGGLTGSIVGLTQKVMENADSIDEQSRKMGVSTDFYQEMDYWAQQNSVSNESFQKAVERLNQRMGRAADGNDKYSDALKDLNVDMDKVKKGTLDTEEAFAQTIKTLSEMDDEQEKSAKASELFGTKLSRELLPALSDGSLSMEEAKEQAHDMGVVLSDEQIDASSKFEQSFDKIKSSIGGVASKIGLELMPYMQDGLDWVQNHLPEIKEKVKDTTDNIINGVKDLVEGYKDLNPKTKKAVKLIGAISTVGGPAVSTLGHLASGIGGVAKVSGSLVSGLGSKGGKGLLGSLTGLTRMGVVGLAIGAVGGLTYGIKKLIDKNKESKEVNLDNAKSLSDEAYQLENATDKFDKLKSKADLTNDELKEINDLNHRISNSSNPDEIAELKDRYNELADKSGLSKDQLDEFVNANDDIIEQAPNVKTAVSESGNEFVEHTDKVRDDIKAMRDWSETKLINEQSKLLQKEKDAQDKLNKAKKDQKQTEKRLNFLADHRNDSKEELNNKIEDTKEKLKDVNHHSEKGRKLDAKLNDLLAIKRDTIGDTIEDLEKEHKENKEIIQDQYDRLNKLHEIDSQMSNIYLKNAGIKEEGVEGLKVLENTIKKHEKERTKLQQKRREQGYLNQKDKDRLQYLNNQLKKEKDSRKNIKENTNMYSDINFLIQKGNDKLQERLNKQAKSVLESDKLNNSEKKSIRKSVKKNKEHDKEIQKLKKKKKKEGANKDEIQKQINKLKNKKKANNQNIQDILKENGLWNDIKNAIQKGKNKEDKKGNSVKNTNSNLEVQKSKEQKVNDKTRTGIGLEQDRTAEAGKDVNKNVDVLPTPTLLDFNNKVKQYQTKPVGINKSSALANLNDDVSKPVNKTVNLSAKPNNTQMAFPLLAHAKGTKGHPYDGAALVGDGKGSNAGRELITPPKSKPFLSPPTDTLMNLPKGTQVTPAKETKQMFPQYANGTDNHVDGSFIFKKLGMMGLGDGLISGGIGDTIAKVTRDSLDTMREMLRTGNKHLNEYSPASQSASAWRPQIKEAAKLLHTSPTRSEINGIISQIALESGGNQDTVQSSDVYDINIAQGNPARGLLQYIPETFSAYQVPGHHDIYSGFDQLLAFFNNTNWRKDLPYGKSGWSPTGATKYADGGFSSTEKLAHISENDKPESIIPLDKGKRTRAVSLLNKTKKALGVPDGGKVVVNNDNDDVIKRQDKQLNMMQQQINLLTQLLTKDHDIVIDGQAVAETVDPHLEKIRNERDVKQSRGRGDM